MSREEADLWRAWSERRDERAFETLVTPHLGFAAGFARRLGCGDADAADVVQRSLASLATETRDKPARVGVRAWLGRSVRSESRMLFRARRRREAHEARAARRPDAAGNPVDARDEVEALLAALDDDDRRAVELRYLYDLDYREIGHVLGRSPLACRLRVHRAVSALRRRLGSHAVMLVAALPHRAGDASSVSVPAAVSAAPAGANLWIGGLAMGTAMKVGGVAAGLGLVAWLGWTALGPSGSGSRDVARAGDG
jgi:RNA polymerase sigma factor (sigma-70 family)